MRTLTPSWASNAAGLTRAVAVLVGFSVLSAHGAVVCPDRPITLAYFQTPVLYADGQGIDKDIVDELQARSKCRFETSAMPRARVWIELQEGRLDMTTSVLPTPEREQSIWILNYLQLRNYWLLSREQAGHIKSLHDFSTAAKPLQVGKVRGYKHGDVYDAWLAELASQNRVQEVVETTALYRMLKLGRIQALISSPMTYQLMLQEQDMSDQVVIVDWGGEGASSPRGLGLGKRSFSEAQAREWQALIETMKRDGTIRRIIEKHLGKTEAKAMLVK